MVTESETASEEFFDIVDEHDCVIGVLPRSEVHRLGLRHRAVHIFLFRSDGCMLLHLRSADKEEFPSVWTSSASGHVSAGDTYAESAVRELQEELDVRTPLTQVGRYAACPDTCNEFTELYIGTHDGNVTVDSTEISDIRWQLPEAIEAEIAARADSFSPAFRMLFADFRQRFGTGSPWVR